MKLLLFSLLLLFSKAQATPGAADDLLPLYELGFGVGSSYHPHYPGSDQSRLDTLPFPYGVYRGKVLYADRRGNARARLLRNDVWELSLSGGGGFPIKSTENSARTGMQDLDWMGQIGPRILVRLMDLPNGQTLRLGLPFRAVLTSADFKTYIHRGYIYAPELIYSGFLSENVNFFSVLTIAASDQNFMEYVYGVSPADATPTRKAFEAQRGYFNSSFTVGFSIDTWKRRLRLMPVATLASQHGAANQDSPLMKTLTNITLGLVIIPIVYHSDKLVPADD
jgi:outer membrane protein